MRPLTAVNFTEIIANKFDATNRQFNYDSLYACSMQLNKKVDGRTGGREDGRTGGRDKENFQENY